MTLRAISVRPSREVAVTGKLPGGGGGMERSGSLQRISSVNNLVKNGSMDVASPQIGVGPARYCAQFLVCPTRLRECPAGQPDCRAGLLMSAQ